MGTPEGTVRILVLVDSACTKKRQSGDCQRVYGQIILGVKSKL
jgi:hypothetical protein